MTLLALLPLAAAKPDLFDMPIWSLACLGLFLLSVPVALLPGVFSREHVHDTQTYAAIFGIIMVTVFGVSALWFTS